MGGDGMADGRMGGDGPPWPRSSPHRADPARGGPSAAMEDGDDGGRRAQRGRADPARGGPTTTGSRRPRGRPWSGGRAGGRGWRRADARGRKEATTGGGGRRRGSDGGEDLAAAAAEPRREDGPRQAAQEAGGSATGGSATAEWRAGTAARQAEWTAAARMEARGRATGGREKRIRRRESGSTDGGARREDGLLLL